MKNKKTLIIISILLLGLAAGVFWQINNRNNSTPATSVEQGEKIDYSPATEDDRKRAEQHKEDLVKQAEQQTQTPQTGNTVTPIIISSSYANSKVTIRSFVPSIVEDGGTCTITLTNNGQTVSRQAGATRNAQTTDCPPTSIDRSEIPAAGTWKVIVSYNSASSSGSSAPGTVEVQ